MRVNACHGIVAIWLATSALAMPASDAPRAATPAFMGETLPGEDTPKKVEPPASGGACAADIGERNGIVSLVLSNPAKAGQQTTFTLDEITYAARFDAQGHLSTEAPIFHATADLDWTGSDGSDCHHRGIAFTDFMTADETALVWTAGTIDLALHVVEPNGHLRGPQGYVFRGRPNADLATGIGQLRRFGAQIPGTSQVELYSVAPDRNPRAGYIYTFVEFVTRGNPARSPYCGTGPLAQTSYRILHLDGGRLERRGGAFGTVPCGTAWSDAVLESEYFQRWKWGL